MGTYSFLDVQASLVGPTGSFPIGAGAGSAKEGITTAMEEDKGSTMTGADGEIAQSLHAGNTGMITIRLLKTSPVNRLLMLAYNTQRISSQLWGKNAINVSDVVRGDLVNGSEMAFVKAPDLTWAEDANTVEWVFRGKVFEVLGDGNSVAA